MLPSKLGVTNGWKAPFISRPSPRPGPEAKMPTQRESIGTTRQTRDPGVSYVGFQPLDRVRLRDAVMPVDKGRLPSEPKAAFPVRQY